MDDPEGLMDNEVVDIKDSLGIKSPSLTALISNAAVGEVVPIPTCARAFVPVIINNNKPACKNFRI